MKKLSCLLLILCSLPTYAVETESTVVENEIAVEPVEDDKSTLANVAYGLFKPVPSEPYWYFHTSVYTQHFDPKPHHNNNQELIAFERNRDDSYLWGAGTFLNSFYQRSYMAYIGKRYDFGNTPFYSRLTFGFIYGYRGEYKRKVPMNDLGVAPAILPSLGVKTKYVHADVFLLGANAYIVTAGFRF